MLVVVVRVRVHERDERGLGRPVRPSDEDRSGHDDGEEQRAAGQRARDAGVGPVDARTTRCG